MDLEMRPIIDDETTAFYRAIATGFGDLRRDDDLLGPWGLALAPERTLAVFDDEEIVATAGAYSFQLTVPGGAQVPTAGVTVVTVRPTHRRRGLLVGMMDEQLDDVARRGEPLAALTASESLIYGRFGYGQASSITRWELDTDFAAFSSLPDAGGRFRLVDPGVAATLVGAVYDDVARSRVGEVTRGPGWWAHLYDESRPQSRDNRPFFTVVHEDHAGTVDGFARYALEPAWPQGQAAYTLRAHEVLAPDPDTEAALWRYLLDVDLVATVAAADRPVDETLRWRLVDPRRLRVTTTVDHLWVRVVDVGAALAARTYGVEDALAFELVDPFRPANSGRWLVEGGPDGATCARTDREPDLALAAADLGALYLGGVDVTTLAHAGRVAERTDGAVARADRFFASHPAPWCSTHF